MIFLLADGISRSGIENWLKDWVGQPGISIDELEQFFWVDKLDEETGEYQPHEMLMYFTDI